MSKQLLITITLHHHTPHRGRSVCIGLSPSYIEVISAFGILWIWQCGHRRNRYLRRSLAGVDPSWRCERTSSLWRQCPCRILHFLARNRVSALFYKRWWKGLWTFSREECSRLLLHFILEGKLKLFAMIMEELSVSELIEEETYNSFEWCMFWTH